MLASFLLTLFLSSALAIDPCPDGFVGIARELPASTPRSLTDLHPMVQKWIESRQDRLKGLAIFKRKVGQDLVVNGQLMRVVAHLGKGAEAGVSLVQTGSGLKSAKVFDSDTIFQQNLASLKKHNHWADFPKVLEIDHGNRTIIMEYIEGVPVDRVRTEAYQFGLSHPEQQRILREWAVEMRRLAPLTESSSAPADYNVVYSFSTGRFRVIDPH